MIGPYIDKPLEDRVILVVKQYLGKDLKPPLTYGDLFPILWKCFDSLEERLLLLEKEVT